LGGTATRFRPRSKLPATCGADDGGSLGAVRRPKHSAQAAAEVDLDELRATFIVIARDLEKTNLPIVNDREVS